MKININRSIKIWISRKQRPLVKKYENNNNNNKWTNQLDEYQTRASIRLVDYHRLVRVGPPNYISQNLCEDGSHNKTYIYRTFTWDIELLHENSSHFSIKELILWKPTWRHANHEGQGDRSEGWRVRKPCLITQYLYLLNFFPAMRSTLSATFKQKQTQNLVQLVLVATANPLLLTGIETEKCWETTWHGRIIHSGKAKIGNLLGKER